MNIQEIAKEALIRKFEKMSVEELIQYVEKPTFSLNRDLKFEIINYSGTGLLHKNSEAQKK